MDKENKDEIHLLMTKELLSMFRKYNIGCVEAMAFLHESYFTFLHTLVQLSDKDTVLEDFKGIKSEIMEILNQIDAEIECQKQVDLKNVD